jgi:hypothetical protein
MLEEVRNEKASLAAYNQTHSLEQHIHASKIIKK